MSQTLLQLRYYNEEKSELHERALKLQKLLMVQLSPEDSSETIVLVNRAMLQIVNTLSRDTEIEELTQSDGNSKFVNMSFRLEWDVKLFLLDLS